MKNIVIDTSVAIKWFFPESGSDKANGLKEKQLKGNISIHTRDLFLYEFTSAFKNYSQPKIDDKDFSFAVTSLNSLNIKYIPLRFQELDDLFSLSARAGISIYDGSFILLAQKLKAPLFTSDKKLYLKCKDFVETMLI